MKERKKYTGADAAAVLRGLVQKKNALFFLGLAGMLLIFLSDVLFAPHPSKDEAAAQPAPQTAQRGQTERELEARLKTTARRYMPTMSKTIRKQRPAAQTAPQNAANRMKASMC